MTRFVRPNDDAVDYCDVLHKQIESLQAELLEQCRLNGMGAEREAKLMGEVERLKRQRDVALKGLHKCALSFPVCDRYEYEALEEIGELK